MAKDMLIMFEDTHVMRVNFNEGVYDVLCEALLPFPIKNRLKRVPAFEDIKSRYDMVQASIAMDKNKDAVTSWLANRVLSLSRANAKWIYNLLKFEQINSQEQKAKIAITCRGVSLLDNYWLKLEDDSASWSQVNLRHNQLNEVIAQVALHGKSLTLQGSLTTPELTTNGAYAKAWRRHEDGSLWLYKLGANGNTESRIEVMCSNLLDKMTVKHCHYEAGEDDGKYVCMCPCMSDDNISILSGMDFISYCNASGLDPDKEMMRIDSDSIYKMWIVDYLLCNRDRHGQNWGFYYDPRTMEILRCHPLFDHNNAFDIEYMRDREAHYQFGDMTTREAAKRAMQHVDFYFTEPITRDDFITKRQFDEFMWRAKDLGITTLSGYTKRVYDKMQEFAVPYSLDKVFSLLPDAELDDEALTVAIHTLQ